MNGECYEECKDYGRLGFVCQYFHGKLYRLNIITQMAKE